MEKEFFVISRKWLSGRGRYTSVERFCEILSKNFLEDHGKLVRMPYRIGQWLKRWTNSKVIDSYSAPYTSKSAELELFGLVQIIKRRPKIVFYPYADYDYYYLHLFRKLLGYRIVLWSYFSEWELKNRFKNLSHFKKADVILVAGKGQYEYLRKKLPLSNVVFFPMGVDTEFFVPSSSFEEFMVVHSGMNRRDFVTLINAFDLLYKEFPNIKLELIGASSVLEQFPERPYLIVHGYLTDNEMLKVYQKANIQVLSLSDGGSSNSLNEGISCGLPLVVTRLNNICDYYDETFALEFDKGDYEGLYKGVKLLLLDNSLRMKFSVNARKRSLEYSWGHLKDEFWDIMTRIS